jgi:RNA polymerase sigma factor (sigma-70 family)
MSASAFALAAAAADDATLVSRYLAGDDHAFASLLARHQSRVFTTLVLIVRDQALAEDLTQDTFVKVVKMLREGRYQHEGKFGAWVCRIAHNLGIDATRRQKRQAMVSLDAPLATDRPTASLPGRGALLPDAAAPSPEATAIRQENHDHLRRLIEDLPAAQREMTFQEIADATGVSVNTALGRMRYALVNLRRRMLPTASATGASLLLGLLLAAGGSFSIPSAETGRALRPGEATLFSLEADSDDSTLYPGNADPVRLQRLT